jgi:hypothetical protein
VSKVQSFGFVARCKAGDGSRRFVHAGWDQGEGNTFTGSLQVTS